MDNDFNSYSHSSYSPYMNYGSSQPQADDFSSMYSDPNFNPIMQYEQAYSYYRFLCMQMDYKIKCKEYEKLCNLNDKSKTNTINASSGNVNSNMRPK